MFNLGRKCYVVSFRLYEVLGVITLFYSRISLYSQSPLVFPSRLLPFPSFHRSPFSNSSFLLLLLLLSLPLFLSSSPSRSALVTFLFLRKFRSPARVKVKGSSFVLSLIIRHYKSSFYFLFVVIFQRYNPDIVEIGWCTFDLSLLRHRESFFESCVIINFCLCFHLSCFVHLLFCFLHIFMIDFLAILFQFICTCVFSSSIFIVSSVMSSNAFFLLYRTGHVHCGVLSVQVHKLSLEATEN